MGMGFAPTWLRQVSLTSHHHFNHCWMSITECKPTSGGGQWSLSLPTNPIWWGSMHAISSYRGNRPTNKQTQPQTHRQDRLQYTEPQLARSVMT